MIEVKFLESAEKFHEYHLKNQIKTANKYAKKMHMLLIDIMKEDGYKSFFDYILSSNNDIAIIWACGGCIDCNYRKQEAIEILERLSHSKDEIISCDANMLLFVKTKMVEKQCVKVVCQGGGSLDTH